MISRQLSDKIRFVSFLCTLMVVFRHSLNMEAFEIDGNGHSYVSIIENGISKLTEVAVPYFFLVSGFFFLRYSYFGKGEYLKMLCKKAHTLFLPFVFWNIVGLIPLVLMHRVAIENSLWKYSLQLLNSEWNGVLWYVRDIMIMMLLAPLYSWVFLLNRRWLYALLFLLLFFNWMPVDCSLLSTEGMLFFFLGGVLQKKSSFLEKKFPKWTIFFGCVVWLISSFAFPHCWAIHRYNTLLGLFVVWQLCDYVPTRVFLGVLGVSSYSFFIYVLHADVIKSMKVGLAHFFCGQEAVALASYFVLPLVTVSVLLIVGKLFNRYIPQVFNFVMGGRC